MHVVRLPCRVLYCILFMHAPIKDGKDASANGTTEKKWGGKVH